MHAILLVVTLAFGQVQAPGAANGGAAMDDVASAKALYASASYEEALSRVTSSTATGDSLQLAEYQGLCLLALGRTDEADRTFTVIVLQHPTFTISDSDFSPKAVAFFKGVRHKVLPDAAKVLYARAKSDYDGKNFEHSAEEFQLLTGLLGDADLADQEASVADLKLLAGGFLSLATAAAEEAAKPPAPPAPAPSAAPVVAAPAPPRIYAASDTDVSAPVEVDRKIPDWTPPSLAARMMTYRGVMELVVDETGAVQSAVLRQPTASDAYNDLLLAAAKSWKFKPARRGGTAVSYRMFTEIVFSPKK